MKLVYLLGAAALWCNFFIHILSSSLFLLFSLCMKKVVANVPWSLLQGPLLCWTRKISENSCGRVRGRFDNVGWRSVKQQQRDVVDCDDLISHTTQTQCWGFEAALWKIESFYRARKCLWRWYVVIDASLRWWYRGLGPVNREPSPFAIHWFISLANWYWHDLFVEDLTLAAS